MILAIYKKDTKKSPWLLVKLASTMLEANIAATQIRKHSREIGFANVKTTVKAFNSEREVPVIVNEVTPLKMLYN